jgi:hypothetical protein
MHLSVLDSAGLINQLSEKWLKKRLSAGLKAQLIDLQYNVRDMDFGVTKVRFCEF